ncbi:glucan synthase-like 1 [Actinidia rufa]|uniref:Glucan synthase-like 1 n=1 Tax=Actinidia rufa TaxID=165716 RepID=A0A7J0FPH5_9ERIC|nr:glucan synthase-like 1 [Actinidia rufa]
MASSDNCREAMGVYSPPTAATPNSSSAANIVAWEGKEYPWQALEIRDVQVKLPTVFITWSDLRLLQPVLDRALNIFNLKPEDQITSPLATMLHKLRDAIHRLKLRCGLGHFYKKTESSQGYSLAVFPNFYDSIRYLSRKIIKYNTEEYSIVSKLFTEIDNDIQIEKFTWAYKMTVYARFSCLEIQCIMSQKISRQDDVFPFFSNSLFMNMPRAPQVGKMMAFSVRLLTTMKKFCMGKNRFEVQNEDGISTLFYLQKIYEDEWENFMEQMFREGMRDDKDIWSTKARDLRLWASYRGQTLDANKPPGTSIELVTQVFCLKGMNSGHFVPDEERGHSCCFEVHFGREEVEYYSVLVKYDQQLKKEVEIYRIRLPGPLKIGEGKPENQNHAIIFTRGDAVQTIDMNQDNCFEEALKMRNLLEEFKKHYGIRKPTILGVSEYVFTGSVSSLAWFMSAQETSFMTLGQRVLANPLKVRMHYGHPDVFDRFWFLTRSGSYFNTMMVVLTVYAFLWGRLYLALSGVELEAKGRASSGNNDALGTIINQQFIIQNGLFTALPMIVENSLEHCSFMHPLAKNTFVYIAMTISCWFLAVSWMMSPFVFKPSGFDWLETVYDFDDFMNWIWYIGVLVKADQSWETWWYEEQNHLRTTGVWGKLLEIILDLRFFFLQYGIVYRLKIADGNKSIGVYLLSWLYMVAAVTIYVVMIYAWDKYAAKEHKNYLLVQVLVTVATVVVIVFCCCNLPTLYFLISHHEHVGIHLHGMGPYTYCPGPKAFSVVHSGVGDFLFPWLGRMIWCLG